MPACPAQGLPRWLKGVRPPILPERCRDRDRVPRWPARDVLEIWPCHPAIRFLARAVGHRLRRPRKGQLVTYPTESPIVHAQRLTIGELGPHQGVGQRHQNRHSPAPGLPGPSSNASDRALYSQAAGGNDMTSLVAGLDAGTHACRTLLFDRQARVISEVSVETDLIHPTTDAVEMDPQRILDAQIESFTRATADAISRGHSICAVGLTNQRETAMIWDRDTGQPVHNAIVWMSRQTDGIVQTWRGMNFDERITSSTGLPLNSYFSASKIAWILKNVPKARERAQQGDLAAGTVDSWLLWNLTRGRLLATDYSNASRTMLFDIRRLEWDRDLCYQFDIPISILPPVHPSSHDFGITDPDLLGIEAPILGVLGDGQAGLFGQTCFEPGQAKYTFGTAGCLTMNTGGVIESFPGITSSVAWASEEDATTYEVEGVVFHSGQTLTWLRDGMKLISSLDEVAACAKSASSTRGVYFVPAFTGLGGPHWDASSRAIITGMDLQTSKAHIIRAALESLAYQVKDSISILERRSGRVEKRLRVDGGGAVSDFLCQFLADILQWEVIRPAVTEMGARGAAFLAGLRGGYWESQEELLAITEIDRIFEPRMSEAQASALYEGWAAACERSRGMVPS